MPTGAAGVLVVLVTAAARFPLAVAQFLFAALAALAVAGFHVDKFAVTVRHWLRVHFNSFPGVAA